MNKEVEKYLNSLENWQEELIKLHGLILDCGLMEEFKRKHPCYTYNKKNIVLIHGFRDYCAILFHKRSLVKRPNEYFSPANSEYTICSSNTIYEYRRNQKIGIHN